MRISDWSSDVCSSDLVRKRAHVTAVAVVTTADDRRIARRIGHGDGIGALVSRGSIVQRQIIFAHGFANHLTKAPARKQFMRSEEHTSELKSLMRISYAVFCLKKKKTRIHIKHVTQ